MMAISESPQYVKRGINNELREALDVTRLPTKQRSTAPRLP
ncbi:hypothetical protein [Streptomyces sp. NPDC050388]